MRVLLIEDNPVERHFYSTQLEENGHVVDSPDGTGGRDIGSDGLLLGLDEKSGFDIAIVDQILGEDSRLSGTGIIRKWREAGRCFPIMLLTAAGREHRVEALASGADSFVEKPLKPRELLAEVHALVLREPRPCRKPDFRRTLPPFELRLVERTVTRDGEPVRLTPTEYKLAELFMMRPGRTIETALLEEMVEKWSPKELKRPGQSVREHIRNLRRKLDPEETIDPIETRTGIGYRFRQPKQPG